MMTKKETYKIKIGTFTRVKYNDGAKDGILVENEKDDIYMKVFFPSDEIIDVIDIEQIYKIGKVAEFDFDNSGLWD